MQVVAKCPNCRAEFDATDYDPGDQFQCPDCGAIVTVPSAQAKPAKKLSISDRTRIGSGIKKKSVGRKPVRQRNGQVRRSSGTRRPGSQRPGSTNRPASSSRPASQQRPQHPRNINREDEEYSVEPQSNSKKMILIFSGLAVIAIVLVVVLFMLNQSEDPKPIDKTAETDENTTVTNEPANPIVNPDENVEDTKTPEDTTNKDDETKKDEPVAPKEITRSDEYKKLIQDYFNDVVTKKIDDSDFIDNLERLSVSKLRSETENILKTYKKFPTLDCPDDYFFRGLFNPIQEEAIENYSKCIDLLTNGVKWKFNDLTCYAYFNRGVEYMRGRDTTDKALEDFAVVVEMQPEFAPVYYHRAKAYFRQEKYQEAYWDIQSAVKYNEEYGEYRELKEMKNRCAAEGAQPRITDEDRREAIEELTEKIEENENDANSLYHRGIQYIALKEWKKAEADFTKCLEILGNNPQTRESDLIEIKRQRIICWRELGKYDDALKGVIELLRVKIDDPMLLATKGLILLKMKRYREAKVELEFAIEKDRSGKLKDSQQIKDALQEIEDNLKK